MQTALKASEFLDPLPLELFIYVLSSSLTELEPIEALTRLEQLRLVCKAWRFTIDFTPRFWTTIPNNPKAASKMKEWIKKSGDAPLHIISNKLTHSVEPFMSLLGPHVHRWKIVRIHAHWDASGYFKLDRPAPLLQNLTLVGARFGPDAILCSGIMPSLTKVGLFHVTLPQDLSFLKHLKELELWRITYLTDKLSISQIYDILSACPNLRRLCLNLEYKEDTHRRTPITFPSLRDLIVQSRQRITACAADLLSIIDAPNLINISTRFDAGPSTQVLQLAVSWLTRLSLHQATRHDVNIGDWSLSVSILREQDDTNSSQPCQLSLSWPSATPPGNAGPQILEAIDKFGFQYPPLALIIVDPRPTSTVIEYLKQPKVNEDGTQTWPLPTLRSVHFRLWGGPPSWDCISGFALVRTDIAQITSEPTSPSELDENWRKWDAESMSFIPFRPE